MDERVSYSISDAVKVSGIGRTSVYEAIKAGRLQARKLGRRTLILKTDLHQWVAGLPAIKSQVR